MKEIDIEVQPVGQHCRVMVDGEDLPCRKFIITAEVGHITKVELEFFKRGGEPYKIKGYLVENKDANGG